MCGGTAGLVLRGDDDPYADCLVGAPRPRVAGGQFGPCSSAAGRPGRRRPSRRRSGAARAHRGDRLPSRRRPAAALRNGPRSAARRRPARGGRLRGAASRRRRSWPAHGHSIAADDRHGTGPAPDGAGATASSADGDARIERQRGHRRPASMSAKIISSSTTVSLVATSLSSSEAKRTVRPAGTS